MRASRVRRDVATGWGAFAWSLLALSAVSTPSWAEPPSSSPQAVTPSPQCIACGGPSGASGQAIIPGEANVPITSIDQLVRLSAPALEQLYRQSPPAPIPSGKVKGRALLYPGTRMAVPASNVARFMWQGKVFNADDATAVNRFFGVRAIRGNLYLGESWLDGQPSLILDYSETSRIYAANRDEIREVGPGLFLGLMYARTQPQPTFKMYFALSTHP